MKNNENNIVETYEQLEIKTQILNDSSSEISYIAPTSFGKSSIIIEHIKNNINNKIAIIVPTKSLLNQTYKSIKNESKLVCEFDEFTENSYLNQILKSTCKLLIFKGDIKHENRGRLKKLMLYFSNVDEVDLKCVSWNSISYHRNNSTYKMLINLCYLIVKGLLITTEKGEQKLGKYLDDQHMHKLYEKFVLEYYRKHYPELKPNPSQIKWDVETDCSIEFLPSMNTDIMLTGNEKTLIIDTKFYSKSMQTNYDKKSIISNNLYQIFTYVKNQDKDNSGDVSGLLLYAKTDEDVTPDCEYKMGGNNITVKTLDLCRDWGDIKCQLNNIANYLNE